MENMRVQWLLLSCSDNTLRYSWRVEELWRHLAEPNVTLVNWDSGTARLKYCLAGSSCYAEAKREDKCL